MIHRVIWRVSEYCLDLIELVLSMFCRAVSEQKLRGGAEERRRQIAIGRHKLASQGRRQGRQKAKRSEQKTPSAGRGFGAVTGGLLYDRRPKASADCGCGLGQPYASGFFDRWGSAAKQFDLRRAALSSSNRPANESVSLIIL